MKKAAANLRKHGISFEEAATAFADPLAVVLPDVLRADRWILVGYSAKSRLLYAVFAEVAEDVTRIISARLATAHERRRYEEE